MANSESDMRRRIIGALLAVTIALAAPFVAEPWIQAHNHPDWRAEKHGRVVDADSGKGIPDVNVLVNWECGGTGAGGSWSACVLKKFVTTDAEGNYIVPDVSKEIEFQRFWLKQLVAPLVFITAPTIDYRWRMVAFKQGYVAIQDEKILEGAVKKNTFPRFLWREEPPKLQSMTPLVIENIPLHRIEMNLSERVVYYAALVNAIERYMARDAESRKMRAALIEPMAQEVRLFPCTLNASTLIRGELLKSFVALQETSFFDRMTKLTGSERWIVDGASATTLCQAVGSEARNQ